MDIKISVIISTKNEERNIGGILESLKKQTLQPFEIIVVDNNSSDRTAEIAKSFTPLVFDKGPERSAQRNFGIREAKGNYILYLDADMILSPQILASLRDKILLNPSLKGLYIPEVVVGEGFWVKVRRFERGFYDATVIDAVRFFPKEVFEKIGGFDETMNGSEDWDFDKRVRQFGEVDIISEALLHNEDGFSLNHYLGKKTYYQPTWDTYVAKWGRNDPDVKKQLGFWYRYFAVFMENGKSLRLIRHPILTVGMYFLRFMVGFGYLKNRLTN